MPISCSSAVSTSAASSLLSAAEIDVIIVIVVYIVLFTCGCFIFKRLIDTGHLEIHDVESDEVELIKNKQDAGDCSVKPLEEEDVDPNPPNEEEDDNPSADEDPIIDLKKD